MNEDESQSNYIILITKQLFINPPCIYVYTCLPITPMMKRVESMEEAACRLIVSKETAGRRPRAQTSKRSKAVDPNRTYDMDEIHSQLSCFLCCPWLAGERRTSRAAEAYIFQAIEAGRAVQL